MPRYLIKGSQIKDEDVLSEAEHETELHYFKDLNDVTTYSGHAGKYVRAKSDNSGLYYDTPTVSGGDWIDSFGQIERGFYHGTTIPTLSGVPEGSLYFKYTVPATASGSVDLTISVSESGDDGFWFDKTQNGTGTEFYASAANFAIGNQNYYVGRCRTWFRFQNVTIPQGATIESCDVEFKTYHYYTGWAGELDLDIYCNDAANASAPTNKTEYLALNKTTAKVDWNFTTAWTTGGESRYSPDISTCVQEVINRGDWSSGNSLMVLIEDVASTYDRLGRTYDYADSTSSAPKLRITYSV